MRLSRALLSLCLLCATLAACRHEAGIVASDGPPGDAGREASADMPVDAVLDTAGDSAPDLPTSDGAADASSETSADAATDTGADLTGDIALADTTRDLVGSDAFGCNALQALSVGTPSCNAKNSIGGSVDCASNPVKEAYPSGTVFTVTCQSGPAFKEPRCMTGPLNSRNLPIPSGTDQAVVGCTSGVVVGGGCRCDTAVVASHPLLSKNGWQCRCSTTGTNQRAYVVCALADSHCFEIRTGTTNVTCLAGTTLLNGGCAAGTGIVTNGQVGSTREWKCGQNASMTYAICVN
ncbi:MAG: hypothetical protein KC503_19480 [Myxococcales bacterium]|nr:hypothetical protein [Myxococcales bacterium]